MTKTTSTKLDNKYNYNYSTQYIERGWLCGRCGRINAPWVRQCDCSPSAYTISCDKITLNPNDSWWNTQVTCNGTGINPNSTVYTTSTNQAVGGSDYKDSATGNWTNEPKTYTNSTKG